MIHNTGLTLMIHNTGHPIRIIVYNEDTDSCREVTVTPSFEWGGDGWYHMIIIILSNVSLSLGCDVASGMLHRVPPPKT